MADMIGVFGGTFDPPHLGHCILASEAQHQLGLTRVLWVPAGLPPHKPDQPLTPIADRVNMVECITTRNPAFDVSRVDIERPGPHFAKDTLARLEETQPGSLWVYLMGTDSLRDLLEWKDPAIFISRTHAIGVMQRPHIQYNLNDLQLKIPALKTKVRFFDSPLIEISGQDIRARIIAGLPYRYMLPEAVFDFISKRKLYR